MAQVPVLRTDRLVLRGCVADDLDRMAQSLADPIVYAHLSGQPATREDAWRRLLAFAGLWDVLGYGYWAVTRASDGLFLGQVGFADFERDMVPSLRGIPEMGWILSADAHGHGYAGEAVAAGLAWADDVLRAPRTAAIIAPENKASIRVAERAGYVLDRSTEYKALPTLLFYRERASA